MTYPIVEKDGRLFILMGKDKKLPELENMPVPVRILTAMKNSEEMSIKQLMKKDIIRDTSIASSGLERTMKRLLKLGYIDRRERTKQEKRQSGEKATYLWKRTPREPIKRIRFACTNRVLVELEDVI